MVESTTFSKERIAWYSTAFVALLHIIPFLLSGDNAYMRIHDTLEGEWIWLKLLADQNLAWNFDPQAVVPQVMNGLPRSAYPTGLSLNMVMMELGGPYWGYFLNRFLIHCIGFVSMFILLKSHLVKSAQHRYLVIYISLIFATLPVFSVFGISVMGQPLILWAFLHILQHSARWYHYLIILLFPLYSSIVWAGIPILAALGILGIVEVLYRKKIPFLYFTMVGVLALGYLLVNYQILSIAYFAKDFVPHRNAYNVALAGIPTWQGAMAESIMFFTITHYHVSNFVTLPILLAVFLSRNLYQGGFRPSVIVFVIVGICLFQGFYTLLEFYAGPHISFIKTFRLNRFSILLPFLWLVAFALTLVQFERHPFFKKMIPPFIAVQLALVFFSNDEVLHTYRTLLGFQKFPTYKEYLATEQFNEVKQFIGQDPATFRVASVGISPTIAQFNGFYTLDGLQSVYDLNYKLKFREIFKGELAKSQELRAYFDGWGNRCYLFSAELGMRYDAYMNSKFGTKKLKSFEFNASAFRKLGGKYLISGLEIGNAEETGLVLRKQFEHPTSWWKIYLYEAVEQNPAILY